jgi:DNA-binding beta-propeller fold protein YncE
LAILTGLLWAAASGWNKDMINKIKLGPYISLWPRNLTVLFTLILIGQCAIGAPVSIDLPGDNAYPESLSSSKDGTLYVGNLAEGGVVRIRSNAKPEKWIKPGAFGSASILGVLVDEPANTLWVCSNDLSSTGIKIAGGGAGSALIGFDLKTGVGRVRAVFSGGHNYCNDIAVGPDGSAYVTNSDAPQILKLLPGTKQLQVWFSDTSLQPAPNGYGLDGIAFGSDGNVYFNTFDAGGLYRIKVNQGKAGTLTKLNPSRKVALTDGLRPLSPNVFLLIEGQGRLDKMTIKGDAAIIETLKDGYVTPTGVTAVGAVAWVCEGQLDLLGDSTKKPRLPFRLFAVPLAK